MVKGVLKMTQERSTEKNCLVVMMVANTTAPNLLIVKDMISWTTAEDTDSARIHHKADGCLKTKRIGETSWSVATADTSDRNAENMVVNNTCARDRSWQGGGQVGAGR